MSLAPGARIGPYEVVAPLGAGPELDQFILSVVSEEEVRSAATVLLAWPGLLERPR